jgi:hypothetical protein
MGALSVPSAASSMNLIISNEQCNYEQAAEYVIYNFWAIVELYGVLTYGQHTPYGLLWCKIISLQMDQICDQLHVFCHDPPSSFPSLQNFSSPS